MVCVLNDNYELVEDGEIGEIYVAGSNIANGYIKSKFGSHGDRDPSDDRFIKMEDSRFKRIFSQTRE